MQLIPLTIPTKFGTLKIRIQYEGLSASHMRARAELEELPGALSRTLNIIPGINVEDFLQPQELEFPREALREFARQALSAADTPVTVTLVSGEG